VAIAGVARCPATKKQPIGPPIERSAVAAASFPQIDIVEILNLLL